MTEVNEALLRVQKIAFLKDCERIAANLQTDGYSISSHEPQQLFDDLVGNNIGGDVLMSFVIRAVESGVVLNLGNIENDKLLEMAKIPEIRKNEIAKTQHPVFVVEFMLPPILDIVREVVQGYSGTRDEAHFAQNVFWRLEEGNNKGNPVLVACALQLLAHKAPNEIFKYLVPVLENLPEEKRAFAAEPAIKALGKKNPRGLAEWITALPDHPELSCIASAVPQVLVNNLKKSYPGYGQALQKAEIWLRNPQSAGQKIARIVQPPKL